MKRSVKNADVRNYILESGFKNWEVALNLGIADTTLCRWLRYELDYDVKKRIFETVDKMKSEQS